MTIASDAKERPAHDEAKLPQWAQALIKSLRFDAEMLRSELERMGEAHAVLTDREWFTVHGPKDPGSYPNNSYRLWFLGRDDPHPACSLGKGDVLLVGRSRKK